MESYSTMETEKTELKEQSRSVVRVEDIKSWSKSFETYNLRATSFVNRKFVGRKQLDDQVDLQFSPLIPITPNSQANQKIALWKGDITRLQVDAIVNAARPSLLGGGGIDRAIHLGAGKELLEECKPLNGCKHGETKITQGYQLPCKYILHTVGPNRDLHTEEEGYPLLRKCYLTCLDKVVERDIKTVAFCSISTGAYRFPLRNTAHVALNTIRNWMDKEENLKRVSLIILNVFSEEDESIYAELMPLYFPMKRTLLDDINSYWRAFSLDTICGI